MRQESNGLPCRNSIPREPVTINVIIADHQPVFRAGLAKLLAAEDDIRIVAQAKSPEHLLNALETLRSSVVILSSGFFPATTDILHFSALAARRCVAILILIGNTETASQYISLGVAGVFYRSINTEMLVTGVRQLSRGGSYLQTLVAAVEISPDTVGERVTSRLSAIELQIIAAILHGYKNHEIAVQLQMSVPGVKKAVHTIYDKTGVSDRLELALFVLHHRVLAQAAASVDSSHRGSFANSNKQENHGRVAIVVRSSISELGRRPSNPHNGVPVARTTLGTTESTPNCGK